ncbi:MAG TPA: HyaD/HybD family hydrogenase maturation endopeptidase [Gammaproteobacteria bacterium]|nr:HyaD/HybD family hydrogenase maturation endopeptidase [Gammaproteobacteria bacterium]
MSGQVLVLGLGNTLLTDEGVGVHILRYLETELPVPAGVELMDGGTLSFTLAGPIESSDQLIVIDASELGAAPGTVRVFAGAEMDSFVGGNRKRSVHEVSLLDLMAIAHLTGRLPARRALIGIQPASTDWGDAPTGAVASAIPQAAERVHSLIGEWSQ